MTLPAKVEATIEQAKPAAEEPGRNLILLTDYKIPDEDIPADWKKLFVYGTLKSGGALHAWIDDGAFMYDAVAPGYSLLDMGPYPAMIAVLNKSGDLIAPFKVDGEVWAVPPNVFDAVTNMETRAGYTLETVIVIVDGHEQQHVKSYVYGEVSMGTSEWDIITDNDNKVVGGRVVAR